MRIHRLLCALRQDTSGFAAMETAFAFLLAIPMVLGCFELCMFTYAQTALTDAARVGVRYAIVHGTNSSSCSGPSLGCSDSSGANISSMVNTYAARSLTSLSGATVTVTYPDGSSAPPSRVVVSISYSYLPSFATAGITGLMNARAEGRIVY